MNVIERTGKLSEMKPISKKLVEARQARGLSQKELAKLADEHQSTLSKWETDEEAKPADPKFSVVVRLAKATQTPLWWWAEDMDMPVPPGDDLDKEEALRIVTQVLGGPAAVLKILAGIVPGVILRGTESVTVRSEGPATTIQVDVEPKGSTRKAEANRDDSTRREKGKNQAGPRRDG